MTIWVNTVVNNEENFIWFSIMSVIDYVDKVLIYDTGSTDKTVEIVEEIKKIKGGKIKFKEVGSVHKFQFTKMRQKMLEESNCDWILILDGDEVWWDESIKKVVDTIKKQGDKLDAIVVPFYNAIGDIFHYQRQAAGQYELAGRKGHLTIRAINKKIPGLYVKGPYGQEGYFGEDNNPIQERDSEKIIFLNAPFLHLTHLSRSSTNGHEKFKYELGVSVPGDFKYPEVFSKDKPHDIPSPFKKRSKRYEMISLIREPFLRIKRIS